MNTGHRAGRIAADLLNAAKSTRSGRRWNNRCVTVMTGSLSTHRRLILLLLAFSVSGCGGSADNPSASRTEPSGHVRMLRLLDDIRQATADEHPYLGDASLRKVEGAFYMLSPDAPAIDRFRLLAMLGAHEMRLGRNKRALEHLGKAYDLIPQAKGQITDQLVNSVLFTIALTHLRIAETENCVQCRNGDSCILPIRGGGIHTKQSGSRNAIHYLKMLLKRNPRHLTGRWLFNIASMTLGTYPDHVPKKYLIPPRAFESEETFPRFKNISANIGLDTFSLSGGTIVDDFDNDGRLDVMVSSWDTAGQLRLFHNDGTGTFSERTKEAGLVGLFGGLNLLQADYDNDGDVDVLVLRGAWLGGRGRYPNSLLQNDGRGRFQDVTFEAGLGLVHYPTQTASWADYDNDGDLDLYIGNERFPDQLFRNNGNGTFLDVASQTGIDNPLMTKGVIWGDYNNDRFPDVYVSNLDGPNKLYRNNGNGTFTDVAGELGVEKPISSFPTWFWDFNNDGALDLYVASYNATARDVAADYLGLPNQAQPDCLYQGDGTGRFRNVTRKQNLPRVTQPMGCNFGDLDNDGFPDFYLGTGDVPFESLMPNRLLHNRRGNRFADVTTASGTGHLQKGHGVAFADLDDDGDQDLFVELGGALSTDGFANALFENPGFGNHWIKIKLIGTCSNRSAIGARIHLVLEDGGQIRSVYKWVNSGGSFGAKPLRQEIGVGRSGRIRSLEIYWPTSNRTQHFDDVAVDQFLEITEAEDRYRKRKLRPFQFRRPKKSKAILR